MAENTTGTREEWQAARDELAKLEAEQAQRDEEVERKRRQLPWVPVEKEYVFDTEDGKKTLAELFDGRSQLLAYNIMFGPDYENGACPGCTNLADGLEGSLVHLNHRDVTLICFSRALTEEQAEDVPEVQQLIDSPPGWLEEWSGQIGAELKDGLREAPTWIAFAR